ncbi:hypothetical protein [Streptomyces sp. NPDC005262]|uniref:hypothetical protein n=1 Tax=Streptomyces sp. NPDC005262 TaxID=3364710 RepID=UPI0036A3C020
MAGTVTASICVGSLLGALVGGWLGDRIGQRRGGKWTAVLDHTGAAGKQVTTKATFTDANGNAVTQTVIRAYDVR